MTEAQAIPTSDVEYVKELYPRLKPDDAAIETAVGVNDAVCKRRAADAPYLASPGTAGEAARRQDQQRQQAI